MTIHVTPHDQVEHEAAYVRAAESLIKGRAAVKKQREFVAANPDGEQILQFIADKAFAWASEKDWHYADHDMRKLQPRTFFDKLHLSIDEWGAPTQGQADAVRRIMDQEDAKKAAWAARDAKSEHIGSVGDKINLEAVVSFTTSFETQWGFTDITVFRAGDNVIVHKGTAPLIVSQYKDQWGNAEKLPVKKGDRVLLKATIKEHGERNGVKQTIVTRPKTTLVVEA